MGSFGIDSFEILENTQKINLIKKKRRKLRILSNRLKDHCTHNSSKQTTLSLKLRSFIIYDLQGTHESSILMELMELQAFQLKILKVELTISA